MNRNLFFAIVVVMVMVSGCATMQPLPPISDGSEGAEVVVDQNQPQESGILWISQCGSGGIFGALGALLGGCPPTTRCDNPNRFCCMNPGHPSCSVHGPAVAGGGAWQRWPAPVPNATGFDRLRRGDELTHPFFTSPWNGVRCDFRCESWDAACRARLGACEGRRDAVNEMRRAEDDEARRIQEETRRRTKCRILGNCPEDYPAE